MEAIETLRAWFAAMPADLFPSASHFVSILSAIIGEG
jgi:hypothetical protein